MGRGTKRLLLGYSIAAVLAFVLFALAAVQAPYFAGDVEITRAVQTFRSPALDLLMDAAGQAGFPPQTLVLNALFVLIVLACGMKREALTLFLFIPTLGTIQTVIRYGIDRPRPSPDLVWVLHLVENRHFSFPSGHAVNFVSALGFLMYIGYTRLPPSWHRNLLLGACAGAIALVSFSRIYVGDHWTSDVLGGLLLGSAFLAWMILFYEWLRARGATASEATASNAVERKRVKV